MDENVRVRTVRQPRREEPGPEAPYPLLRRFVLLVLPVLVIALAGLLAAAAYALSASVERAFEAEASRRQATLLSIVATEAPEALAAPAAGRVASPAARAAADRALADEARETELDCAVLLRPDGETIATAGLPCPPLTDEDHEALARRGATLFREIGTDPLAWMVASTLTGPGDAPVVVVTTRPAATEERVIGSSALVLSGGLALLLVGGLGVATVLIARAQREIDRRTGALREARAALARFVSLHTRESVRLGAAPPRRLTSTVLFLDIRDFSSFADGAAPEAAAALVARVAEIGFAAVMDHGGDVDRLLGDGLIARFEGPDRAARAWAAAEAILARLADAGLPRGAGIGLMDGEVVEATITAGDRADHTILGRTVNLGARLCAAAGAGEIVAGDPVPPPPAGTRLVEAGREALRLKGHRESLAARRYRTAQGAPGEG